MPENALATMYDQITKRAQAAEVFAGAELRDGLLALQAKDCGSALDYFVDASSDSAAIWVGLMTPDRWLSESIEADLMHRGDDIVELLEDELHDQGLEESLDVQHFRDDDKQYVFRSVAAKRSSAATDDEGAIERILKVLLAYEACFRELGDVCGADDIV
jgi:hypothetical protein